MTGIASLSPKKLPLFLNQVNYMAFEHCSGFLAFSPPVFSPKQYLHEKGDSVPTDQ